MPFLEGTDINNKIKHICFITDYYPTKDNPVFTFVRELVCAIADMGIECTVISSQSKKVAEGIDERQRDYHMVDYTINGSEINIYYPRFVSIAKLNRFGYNSYQRRKVVERCYGQESKNFRIPVDAFYGHFWGSGVIAAFLGKKYHKPAFVASGESKCYMNPVTERYYQKHLKSYMSGCICVSTKNKNESISLQYIDKDKITVIPNAIHRKEFFRKQRNECRELLKYPKDKFILAFVGSFDERKGILRVCQAIQNERDIGAIFIGKGIYNPEISNALFTGVVPHSELVNYLNAADIFVLPTLAEGCCNAIIEALGCGLPVVSSDGTFNDDILNEKYSIRIDSMNVEQIRQAILTLKNNPVLRNEMAEQAYLASESLLLEQRAKKVVEFMQRMGRGVRCE